jgi:hypothetical protein
MQSAGVEFASYLFKNTPLFLSSVAMSDPNRRLTKSNNCRDGLLRIFLFAAAIILLCRQTANAQLLYVDDQTVQSHVAQLRSQILQRDSQEYLAPTVGQRSDFRRLADGLRDAQSTAELESLLPEATELGYDVVVLSNQGGTYYGLQEAALVSARKGWGSFFLRQDATNNALVEVAHPLADINTTGISAHVFAESQARGFLLAGAHRNANGVGTADVAHLDETIFHEAHQSFAADASDLSVWQVHGFNIDLHSQLPRDTDAILSSGIGSVTELVLGLDRNIDALEGDWKSYSFNTLEDDDLLNVATNEDLSGSLFSALGGTTNVQRQHTTSIGGEFVHIELEQSFRIDGGESTRRLISQTIANWIDVSAIAVPEPGALTVVAILGACLLGCRRRDV